jgi:glyoxylase-like metal-dependent hydrolase (beta-lactamase superfamily II)
MLHVHRFEFNPFRENTYVLYDETGECAIIDPGCYSGDERAMLEDFIVSKALRPVYLLNTHCHLDHVFGNLFVAQTWGLPLYLHELEENVLEYATEAGDKYGLPFEGYAGDMRFLVPGEFVKIGNGELKILFTPGHSPGSVSLYNEADGYVIAGDVLFSGSVGRTDLRGGNFDVLEQSIRTQLYSLPDNTKVYPGHGGGTSTGFEKANNPFVRGE